MLSNHYGSTDHKIYKEYKKLERKRTQSLTELTRLNFGWDNYHRVTNTHTYNVPTEINESQIFPFNIQEPNQWSGASGGLLWREREGKDQERKRGWDLGSVIAIRIQRAQFLFIFRNWNLVPCTGDEVRTWPRLGTWPIRQPLNKRVSLGDLESRGQHEVTVTPGFDSVVY